MFVALSILSVGLVFLTGETDAFLPSFSYGNLADKLLKNLAAQRQLAITKEQIAGLDAMLSDTRKELSSILAEKRRKQLSTTNSSQLRSTVLLDQIKLEKNEEHKLALGMILTEFQLDQLRPVFLKVKFKNGIDPFNDDEVLTYCDLSKQDRAKLKLLLSKETELFYSELLSIKNQAVREIVGHLKLLGAHELTAFAHYVGNKHFPEILIQRDFPHESIPFPKSIKLASRLVRLVEDPLLQQDLGLTAEQIGQFSAAYVEYDSKRTYQTNASDWIKLDLTSTTEMLSVLNRDQQLGVYRALMCDEFEKDFGSVLSAPPLVAYLKLSDGDAKSLKLLADEAAEDLGTNLAEANKKFFDRTCGSLPANSREKMRGLFGSHW